MDQEPQSARRTKTPAEIILETPGIPDELKKKLLPIISALTSGGRIMASLIARGPLLGITGSAGKENIQGEEVQTLDRIGQDTFCQLLGETQKVRELLSEEEPLPTLFPQADPDGLLIAMDPLDGSSNISVNASIGSIFAIFSPPPSSDRGEIFGGDKRKLIAGAYILYSASTSFVIAVDQKTYLFTMDPSFGGEFLGTGEPLHFPSGGKIYSTNESYFPLWEKGIQDYITWVKSGRKPVMTSRYIGALVGDLHRNLLKGGIYLYPAEGAPGKNHGKLRLLYEAYPMALICQFAGGIATDGDRSILSIKPGSDLHARVPLIAGPMDLVSEFHTKTGHPL
ncbi:class 1 fructose-bisphosphatase [Leptospirillum ferrooxidans]|jgi:fructose-1,6-bisphosphatase I|uniref:Fructose-1,6-bisphosphatase class 1 n=1 Tax=Leptospirillum ferrooxidans (strain C2-3) TaxID=1162668 RepID=I0IR18_LEPFC|nr:class 1 fructose-bisphosphatase [Leptospirillum ferrooxidans]BAM07717.1 putative fructose-1,6-bisphosphatase [Leptospirillum ferrooxidans C2-3]